MAKIYAGEFERSFLDFLSSMDDAAPIDLFPNPKIFLHDPRTPESCPEALRVDGPVDAALLDIGFIYNSGLDMVQLAVFLAVKGNTNKKIDIYSALGNDAYKNRSTRRFIRSLITATLERYAALTINVTGVDAESETGKLIVKAYYPISKAEALI
jgi:hypothetical protein